MVNKYILFCAQEANFQTRSMLIPYDLIMECEERRKDLEILRNNATKDAKLNFRGKSIVIDQLLVQKIVWDSGWGRAEKTDWNKIARELRQYADGIMTEENETYFFQSYDSMWYPHAICNIVSKGFNHAVNYHSFRSRTMYRGKPIEIVEGFLILESNK